MRSPASTSDALVDLIYGTAVDPSLWPAMLSDLAEAAGGTQAVLMQSDVVSGSSDVWLSQRQDQSVLEPFHRYYAAINPLLTVPDPQAYAATWRPTMLRDDDWMDRSALEASEYYNDFLRPIGARYGIYLRLALHGTSLTSISVGQASDRFDDDAAATLASFHPHLARAVALGRRFAGLRRFAEGAKAAMDTCADPLLMLDDAGRLVHANAPGERLLASGALLREREGRIAATSRHAADAFVRAVAGSTMRGERYGGDVVLAGDEGCDEGRGAARASLLPIAADSVLDGLDAPAVLVHVARPTPQARVDALLSGYGLTAAERSIALILAGGRSVREAAAERGVSIHTARQQLARIYDKTGVHRQGALVRLLAPDEG